MIIIRNHTGPNPGKTGGKPAANAKRENPKAPRGGRGLGGGSSPDGRGPNQFIHRCFWDSLGIDAMARAARLQGTILSPPRPI